MDYVVVSHISCVFLWVGVFRWLSLDFGSVGDFSWLLLLFPHKEPLEVKLEGRIGGKDRILALCSPRNGRDGEDLGQIFSSPLPRHVCLFAYQRGNWKLTFWLDLYLCHHQSCLHERLSLYFMNASLHTCSSTFHIIIRLIIWSNRFK